ncbi:type IV secretion system protein [Neisseria iguanae]|nr:type IV secretion system protein [Neisseria iguanae]
MPVTGDLSKTLPVQNWIATIGFEYADQPMGETECRINPLGFQVTSYRINPETAP